MQIQFLLFHVIYSLHGLFFIAALLTLLPTISTLQAFVTGLIDAAEARAKKALLRFPLLQLELKQHRVFSLFASTSHRL